ncbi:NAD(P)-binding protein [Schizophyllum commune H4-8]|uniref:NAD(P)-binding protein n=1 Tax=Schizophyllum commune (strain H4-8 / FGSC 9210) TaxID=578458 RepID=UPI00215EE330|nr:NAD(P)-binding protein [Schizophyllum commune H4-8]KAI5898200.1 NAD(P)-binding protein [Schizophyllum commune H4-8]
MDSKKTVAIAGAGDVAKFLVEELERAKDYNIVVLTRGHRPWFAERAGITVRLTDYSADSVRTILDDVGAVVLFSFIHDNSPFYNTTHEAFLAACRTSRTCKRFVPSECGGDLDAHPDKPRFYIPTHGAFREVLKAQSEVEWTLLNNGWFMDYVLPPEMSYMKSIVPVWPLDLKTGRVLVPGTGEEPIGLTAARDVARAAVKLVDASAWDPITYVCGENTTWNKLIRDVEEFYKRKFDVSYLSIDEIKTALEVHKNDEDPSALWKAYMDEWNYTGASALPWDKVESQRRRFFRDIKFRTVRELLEDAHADGFA